jgi:tetratricopeptide (TPR) repeat protein
MKSIPPEMLARMLAAARQSLFEGRYQEAIAAYQAVLKRDPKNVDAMTHLGLIVAMGGHADAALETFNKALILDPKYGPALLYKGQSLRGEAGLSRSRHGLGALSRPGSRRRGSPARGRPDPGSQEQGSPALAVSGGVIL